MTPQISIIVPCYNQAQYLDECLQSVLDQTHQNWECIVVNDGSTDNSESIALKFQNLDNRFFYYYQQNKGVCETRNVAISKATSSLILPSVGDDFLDSEYVQKALNCFNKNPDLTLVYPNVMRFGTKNGIWNLPPFFLKNLAVDNMIVVSSVFKKADFDRVGGFDTNMIYGIEDWELWISLLKFGGKVKKINDIGLYYRINKDSRQSNLDASKLKKMQDYIVMKHLDFFILHIGNPIDLKRQQNLLLVANSQKLKNKKFVIDLFCKTFFNFTFFKTKLY